VKIIGEWHLNNLQGCGKVEGANGDTLWGEYKDNKMEGYSTCESIIIKDRFIG
jgi:hypothetical protein